MPIRLSSIFYNYECNNIQSELKYLNTIFIFQSSDIYFTNY